MNNVTTGKIAIEKMIKGIKTVTESIRPTYGHNGINAVVESDKYPYHMVANDAQTIIQAIDVTDLVEKRGLGFLKELSDKQNANAGDGRKTTCIIAETILDEGFKSELKGLALKRELDLLIPLIESKIDHYKQDIGIDDIHKVASIAGESESIGGLIGDIYKNIGKDGVITVEGSGTYQDNITYIEGVRFRNAGFLSPFLAHDEIAKKEGRPEKRAVYENPTILVTKQKITKISEIDPLLQELEARGKKDLVIFTDDMDSHVASLLVDTHKQGIFNILIIKAPSMFRGEIFQDFAKVTGATIVEDASAITLDALPLDCLGTCGKIIVDKDETVVIGIEDIAEHLNELKDNNDEISNLRIQWLNTKTAILQLGANNESELSYRRLKCEDAVSASRLALEDGVIKGGGLTLFDISQEMPNTIVGKIVSKSLQAPLFQIMENSGLTELPTYGDNILDASLVIKNAVRNAIALASTVLTTGIVITLPEKPQPSSLQDNQLQF